MAKYVDGLRKEFLVFITRASLEIQVLGTFVCGREIHDFRVIFVFWEGNRTLGRKYSERREIESKSLGTELLVLNFQNVVEFPRKHGFELPPCWYTSYHN